MRPAPTDPVAYFCAEFAIDNDLPTYSGGLGVLAGDLMNEAALNHYPMVGVGILYKGKDFMQHVTGQGKAETRDSEFDHDVSFLRPTTDYGKQIIVEVDLGETKVKVKSYHIRLSDNTVLFFLSTDVDGNPPEWISDMDTLYKGDANGQIRQQILLGIGGVKILSALGIKPRLFHINEGRPEFLIWEVVRQIMEVQNLNFKEAWSKAKEKIIYTNHTLVTAGNLSYKVNEIENWATPFARQLGVDTNLLIKDGLTDKNTFSTTLFGLNNSKKQTAVSKVHSDYAKREWSNYDWIPITNGVNLFRWQDSDFRQKKLTDRELWDLHMTKKRELVTSTHKRTGFEYDPARLTIAWARRLAEYKQPKVIFSDLERLKKIVTNPEKPVQILFAGNSHSADPNSKALINEIIEIFSKELSGHAIFIPNYNISLANHITSGADVWLNTPKGNLEACGTSGMKAISNGLLNCTVLDGWTYEVNWNEIGWVLDPDNIASNFYDLMEKEIIPMFYTLDENGLPKKWIERMRKSIDLATDYSTERMFNEYKEKLYEL